jgi:hypothetical protein
MSRSGHRRRLEFRLAKRVLQIQHDGQIRGSRQAPVSKKFRFTGIPIYGINPAVPRPLRDVSRSSRYVGCGMRWTLVASGGLCSPDENAAAYGEVVWSWRRDPGATLAASLPLTTGARKAASPGRVRISRKPIARGKPGCLGCTCQIRVHSFTTFAHGAAGAVSARLSLRPLRFRGTTRCKPQAESRRENEGACLSTQ